MEQIWETENLYKAYSKALRGKQGKPDVIAYSKKVEQHIGILQHQLKTGDWEIGRYHYFRIFDPKERLICATSFQERVLHHAIMNICHPYFEKRLIYDTYATRIEKGIYKALDRAREGSRKYQYVAKLDIRKYFDSIDHQTLKLELRRMFKDGNLLQLLDDIIDSYESQPGQGLPIGNLTSQYFANGYLSPIDHYIKEHLHIPIYVRYMDDMLLFGNEKQVLKENVKSVCEELGKIGLCLKPAIVLKTEQGVPFLGYRIYSHKILLLGRGKRRFKHKFNVLNSLLSQSLLDEDEYLRRMQALLAYVKKSYSKQFRLTIMERTV